MLADSLRFQKPTNAKPETVTGNAILTKIINILLLLTLTYNSCYSQSDCDYVYTRQARTYLTKWNRPYIYLNDDLRKIKTLNDKIILLLDTTYNSDIIIHTNYSPEKPELFTLPIKDSISVDGHRHSNYFINDRVKNESILLATSRLPSEYNQEISILKNSFVLYNIGLEKKAEIVLHNFETKSTTHFQTDNFPIEIGNSDTSIFLYINKKNIKISGTKYRKGEIVSLSQNGIYRQPPIKHTGFDTFAISFRPFHNGQYTLKNKFLRQEIIDCDKIDYFRFFVCNKQQAIDSIDCFDKHFGKNSLPKVENSYNRLLVYNDNFFKSYLPNGDIYIWEQKYWSDKLEILNISEPQNYFLVGDTLFIIRQVDLKKLSSSIQFDSLTLNKIPLDKTSTDFQVVLAFDISKNKFLGYPLIKIIDNISKTE